MNDLTHRRVNALAWITHDDLDTAQANPAARQRFQRSSWIVG
jgi:hypothetical protein